MPVRSQELLEFAEHYGQLLEKEVEDRKAARAGSPEKAGAPPAGDG